MTQLYKLVNGSLVDQISPIITWGKSLKPISSNTSLSMVFGQGNRKLYKRLYGHKDFLLLIIALYYMTDRHSWLSKSNKSYYVSKLKLCSVKFRGINLVHNDTLSHYEISFKNYKLPWVLESVKPSSSNWILFDKEVLDRMLSILLTMYYNNPWRLKKKQFNQFSKHAYPDWKRSRDYDDINAFASEYGFKFGLHGFVDVNDEIKAKGVTLVNEDSKETIRKYFSEFDRSYLSTINYKFSSLKLSERVERLKKLMGSP